MLNLKIKTGTLVTILFFSVVRLNAGSSPLYSDSTTFSPANGGNDSSLASLNNNNSAAPQIPLHPSMENFVDDYAEDNEELFEKIRTNKSNYFRSIDKIFIQHDVPVEMKYLAVVESKLKTDARSRVGAVGTWQFMPATAKRFGLKITSKYDERKHFWKSSVAAAKYLNELYDLFGDWLLVIAAYNSGPGYVLNAIKKSGSRSFWKIQYFLPKETRLHVKRFIATHYYFEGSGSLVTLGKNETEKYLRELAAFNSKDNPVDDENTTNPFMNQWVAVVNHEESITFILKK